MTNKAQWRWFVSFGTLPGLQNQWVTVGWLPSPGDNSEPDLSWVQRAHVFFWLEIPGHSAWHPIGPLRLVYILSPRLQRIKDWTGRKVTGAPKQTQPKANPTQTLHHHNKREKKRSTLAHTKLCDRLPESLIPAYVKTVGCCKIQEQCMPIISLV